MTKGTWRGVQVEDLTKEELIEALMHMSELYTNVLNQHVKDAYSLRGIDGNNAPTLYITVDIQRIYD